jgi:hypothetical protein
MSKEEIRKSWLEIFCFMTTSARGLDGEPADYGPFRLIDSLEKILGLLERQGLADEFLKAEKEKIATGKFVLMTDRDEFLRLLDELVMDFTKELKKTGNR